jgi:hypothetical protein
MSRLEIWGATPVEFALFSKKLEWLDFSYARQVKFTLWAKPLRVSVNKSDGA